MKLTALSLKEKAMAEAVVSVLREAGSDSAIANGGSGAIMEVSR